LVGAVSRFFWGRPIPANQRHSRLHAPLASDGQQGEDVAGELLDDLRWITALLSSMPSTVSPLSANRRYLQPNDPGQGATFDGDQEVFTEMELLTLGDPALSGVVLIRSEDGASTRSSTLESGHGDHCGRLDS
jgi:hypothetical protein